MTMNKPLVSVIMPVYNGEKYIRKAVESVYEQGVSLELLVIDDGSTDHTEEVLSAYEGREDFRYIKNEQNMGAAGSRNRGVGLAQGTYIAFLDADDWWESGKLKEQLTAEFRALGIEDMEEVTGLHALKGSFANLEYTLPNGRAVKFWEDNRIYIGHLLKKKNSDRFYGLVADENYLMVCEAGSDGSDAKIVVFKERR